MCYNVTMKQLYALILWLLTVGMAVFLAERGGGLETEKGFRVFVGVMLCVTLMHVLTPPKCE